MKTLTRRACPFLAAFLLPACFGGYGDEFCEGELVPQLRDLYSGFRLAPWLQDQAADGGGQRNFREGLLTAWSSSTLGVPDKAPNRRTDIRQIGLSMAYLDSVDLGEFASRYPEGQGSYAYRLSVNPQVSLQAGLYNFAHFALREDFPLNVTDRHFQYAWVFDQDGMRDNNLQGVAPFDLDFFNGSDALYQLRKSLAAPWTLTANNAFNGNFTARNSSAIALIFGTALVLMFPQAEFLPLLFPPKFRATAFEHGGDYGQAPPHDWYGSVRPERDQHLYQPSWSYLSQRQPQVELDVKFLTATDQFAREVGLTQNQIGSYFDHPSLDWGVRYRSDKDELLRPGLAAGFGDVRLLPRNLMRNYLTPTVQREASLYGGFFGLPGSGMFDVKDHDFYPVDLRLKHDYAVPPLSQLTQRMGDVYGRLGLGVADDLLADGRIGKLNIPTFRLYNGQQGVVQLESHRTQHANLEDSYRTEAEFWLPGTKQFGTGPSFDVQPVLGADLGIELRLRLDTRGISGYAPETVSIPGTDTDWQVQVPIFQRGRTMTSLQVESGETVVIGGLRESGATETAAGVPYLKDVPLVNRLLSSRGLYEEDRELMISVTPRIWHPQYGF